MLAKNAEQNLIFGKWRLHSTLNCCGRWEFSRAGFFQTTPDCSGCLQARSCNLPDTNRSVCWHSPAWRGHSAGLSVSNRRSISLPTPPLLLSHKQLWRQGSGRRWNERDHKEKTSLPHFIPEAVALAWLWLGGRMFSSFVWFYVGSHYGWISVSMTGLVLWVLRRSSLNSQMGLDRSSLESGGVLFCFVSF